MAIGTSSIFKEVLETYELDRIKSGQILKAITDFEGLFNKKIALEKIIVANYNQSLNLSLDYIKNTNTIVSWVSQMKILIMRKKSNIKKKIDLATAKEMKRLETAEIIVSIASKTERDKQKKFFLEEALLEDQYELDNINIDLEAINAFVKEAENERDLAYAYYQAIKNMNLQM